MIKYLVIKSKKLQIMNAEEKFSNIREQTVNTF